MTHPEKPHIDRESINNAILLLEKAIQLIDNKEKWTRKCSARDISNEKVSPFSEYAVCFCASGAVCRATIELRGNAGRHGDLAMTYLNRSCTPTNGFKDIVPFNDRSTYEEVIDVFKAAIKLAKEELAIYPY